MYKINNYLTSVLNNFSYIIHYNVQYGKISLNIRWILKKTDICILKKYCHSKKHYFEDSTEIFSVLISESNSSFPSSNSSSKVFKSMSSQGSIL